MSEPVAMSDSCPQCGNRPPFHSPYCPALAAPPAATPAKPGDAATLPLNVPLWCVYGPDCFPTMFCCVLRDGPGPINIWGYSVYKRQPGFRTLGLSLEEFKRREGDPRFFLTHAEAIAEMTKLTTPKVKP